MPLALGALALQGCVAAAIPVLASGAIVQSERSKGDKDGAANTDPVVEAEVIGARAANQTAASPPANTPPIPAPPPPTIVASPATTAASAPAPIATAQMRDEPQLVLAEEEVGELGTVEVGASNAGAGEVEASAVATENAARGAAAQPDEAPPQLAVVAPTSVPVEPAQPERRTEVAPPLAPTAQASVSPASPDPVPASATASATSFDGFAGYAMRTSALASDDGALTSALLRSPGQLDGERRMCGDEKRAVLVDLDPADSLFDPVKARTANRELASLLSILRAQNMTVAWISGLAADHAGDVRAAIERTGLDRDGTDALLLMRYPDDRKQTRRNEFGLTHCVLAIAGDARSDFDELYDYLINPADAAPLEPLFGEGWFLTPTILTQE